jgi:hypothetical protein
VAASSAANTSGQIDALPCTPPARILVFPMKLSVQKILFVFYFIFVTITTEPEKSQGHVVPQR